MTDVPGPELLLRERTWLLALARQLVQPQEGADELAHDTLVAAMTQAAPRAAGLRGWLAAILRKQLAGRRRAEFRRRAREAVVARTGSSPPTFDIVARFELQREVADAVLALPEPYRSAVLLRYWDDLSPGAISRRLQVPVETVRTRLKRGMTQLRERLDRANGGDRAAWVLPLGGMLERAGCAGLAPWIAGVSLMAAWKFLVGGLVLAAAVWLLVTPWSPFADAGPPAASATVPAAATGGLSASEASPPETRGDREVAERAVVPRPEDPAWLVVTGTVVDDATDSPLPDVPVRLVTWSAGVADVEGVTAPDGTFTLRDTRAPSRVDLQVVALATDYAVARAYVRFDVGSLAQQRIDAGTMRLVRGTLFSGQVLDPAGHGVAGAELLLPLAATYSGSFGPENMLQRTASLGHSDARGNFRLEQPVAPDVDHGNLLFAVAAQGIGWCTFEPSSQRREVADLVIRLRPSGAARVFVEDPTGRPCAGALVRALPRSSPLGIVRRGSRDEVGGPEIVRRQFAGRTDARGELLLPQLPIGERRPDLDNRGANERRYELWVEAEGYPRQPLHALELQAGVEQRVVVRLVATREVIVSVDVRDDLGAPVSGAVVSVGGEVLVNNGRTDATGHVELTVGAVAELSVLAKCAGHRDAHSKFDLGSGAKLQATLTLARTQSLDGRVVDQTGAPAPGMYLFVDHKVVGTTDAEGRFHVDEFPMGLRRIDVALGSGMDGSQWVGTQTPEEVDAAQGPVTIVMQRRPGSVDVRVAIVDAATGQALEPTETMLCLHIDVPEGFFQQKFTRTERGQVISQATPAGRWRLSARTATGQRGSLEFTLTDGQPPVELRLELPVPGSITGRLQFVGVELPATVTLHVQHAHIDPSSFVQFRYPGRWQVDPKSQTVVDNTHGGTGSLRLQPILNTAFRLDAADPTDDLVFMVRGEGVTGQATLRVDPGQTRDLVIEVRAKGK